MASTINFLRLIADPTRLRLLLLLEQEELSVAELQKFSEWVSRVFPATSPN
jgi:ArsR family transcriptional regulator